MTANDTSRPEMAFAARCYSISRVLHWITVVAAIALLMTAVLGNIDPHGSGSGAFLLHSSLGIALYLLTISRVLLWLIYRPAASSAAGFRTTNGIDRTLQIAFYVLLLSLPISGWFLASEEGMHSSLLGIPALPQWYHDAIVQHAAGSSDTPLVMVLNRIHTGLAAALFVVVTTHLLTVIREWRGRRA